MRFILFSISSDLEFWSVNHTSIHENSESNAFKDLKFLTEISNNWANGLLGTNACKTLEFCWWLLLILLQCTNTTAVIPKLKTFSPF